MADQLAPEAEAGGPPTALPTVLLSQESVSRRNVYYSIQKDMRMAMVTRWGTDLPFHEQLTLIAPTESVSEAETGCKKTKKTYKRAKQPHVPVFLDYFLQTYEKEGENVAKVEESNHKRAPPHCRCDACTGFRLRVFFLDLMVWCSDVHFANCNKGQPCTPFCPGQPLCIFKPACLTIEHLEEAERRGWNINAVLKGVGFGPGYRPDDDAHLPLEGMYEFRATLEGYKLNLHTPYCTAATPCRPWCHKSADQLTPADIRDAKDKFPEWQRRMLASEGMAAVVQREKAEREKKEKKAKSLLRRDKQWSEAPLELAEFLGVFPRRIHKPTCCPEVPCVSSQVCFPGEASSSR